MKQRNRILFLCVLLLASALTAWSQDANDSEAVRPTGISPGPVRKAKAVSTKDEEDADISPSPVRKAQAKSSHARSRRTHPKPTETSESAPAPAEYTPDGIPKTGAASVIVVDANTGKTLYEKNADEIRAAGSTQKLLTALIVTERGFLDQPVTVQQVDTLAEPVKLNIKPGDT
jgi:D-alanyl-D-alanine carboxypeptidase